jgi:hypothetical protein
VPNCLSLSPLYILYLPFSPSIQYLFSLSSFPHLNLTIIFLSFAISPQVLRNFLCHTPIILPVVYLDYLILSLLSCLFVSLFQSFCSSSLSIFLLLLLFPLLHWHSRFSDSISLPFFCVFFFLFSAAFRRYPRLLPSIHFVFKLCRSLSRFHFQPIPLALFPHYVTWRFSVHS